MGFLSGGMGGFSRGVENSFKYALENDHGGLERQGVRILVVDGPLKDQYLLPGGFQIDVSDRSKEFYQLHLSPGDVIEDIAGGRRIPFISDWLSPKGAARIPNHSSIDPRSGGGGSRAIGHVIFHLHADDLERAWSEGLREVTGYLSGSDQVPGRDRAIIILKFSPVGAIGAGMGLDNAHLVRSHKDHRSILIGVIPLPNGYDAVIRGQREKIKRDAKAMAILRELVRFQGRGLSTVGYTSSLKVQNDGPLFDLCFLIDGVGLNLSINDVHPVYGICPAVADFELALALDERHIISNLPNWIASIGGKNGESRFASFGVHSYIFPRADLVETFALRFARDIYQMLITPPEGEEEEGEGLANALLEKASFTRLALKLSRGEDLPLAPPTEKREDLLNLIGSFTINSSEAGEFPTNSPDDRILDLSREVRAGGFFGPSNQEVVDSCQNMSDKYIGKEDEKPGRSTVWGWVNSQAEQIEREFEEELRRDIEGIFYDPKKKMPRLLERKPYLLLVARDYLSCLRDLMEPLREELRRTQSYLIDEEGAIEKQREKVEDLERQLLSSKRDRELQREYVSEYQKLMELKIWSIILKSSISLVSRLNAILDRWWQEIGEPAQSWCSFLNQILEDLERQLAEHLSLRSDLARVKVRTYFPSPDDPAERAMYKELVRGQHEKLLSQMSFALYSGRRGEAGSLYLSVPEVEGYRGEEERERRFDLIRSRYVNLRVEDHSPGKIIQYARNFLRSQLKGMDLWDAMSYDYKYCWLPSKEEGEGGIERYVEEMTGRLSEMSHPFLSRRPSGEGEVEATEVSTFCLGHFRNIREADPGSVDELATLFARRMEERVGIHEIEKLKDKVICLSFELGIPIREWAYYPECLAHYREYISDPSAEPIHVYPEEVNALRLEKILEDEKLLDDSYLSPSCVRLLRDLDGFSTFTLAYGLGLIETTGKGEIERPDEYVVRIRTPSGSEVEISLGPVQELDKVIERYLAPENSEARRALRAKLKRYIEQEKADNGLEGVIGKLKQAAENLEIPEEIGAKAEDLRLAMMAVFYKSIASLELKMGGESPRPIPGGSLYL